MDATAGAADSMLRLRLLLLPLLLPGVMTPVEAAGGSSQHPMMAGIMSGDAAHHRTLDAAFGLGAIGRNDEGGGNKQDGNDLHGGDSSDIRLGDCFRLSDNPATCGRVPVSGIIVSRKARPAARAAEAELADGLREQLGREWR